MEIRVQPEIRLKRVESLKNGVNWWYLGLVCELWGNREREREREMQGVGGRIGGLRRCWDQWNRAGCLNGSGRRGAAAVLGLMVGARVFSQSAVAASSSISSLEKDEVSCRILDLLKSTPFIDPSKVFLSLPLLSFSFGSRENAAN